MYYIVESPKVLNLPINDITQVKYIKANRNNMFICAITSNDIMIWYTTTSTMIAFHQRADNSVSIHGENYLVEWKHDSSKIVVMTSKGYLIYFKVTFENEFVINDLSYAQNNDYSVFSNKIQYQNPLLGCKISYEFSVHIQSAFKSLFCFNDEIFVPLLNGNVIKVPWSDRTRADHFFFLLQKIYFKVDTEGELFRLKENVYITEFELINLDEASIGIAAVLSDFSAIYLFFDNSNLFRGIIAKNTHQEKLLHHKCVAVNQLYKIVAFGCKNGLAVAYDLPEDYTTLRLTHFYRPASKDHENANVIHLKWSPDYRCLCVLYDKGQFAIFSVFGSLLYDSKDLLYFYCSNQNYNIVKTLEFGIDGYSLWIYLQNAEIGSVGDIVKLKILKSSLINNSSMSNIEHISLNGEKEVYVCLNLTKTDSFYNYKMIYENKKSNSKKLPPKYQYPSQKLGGNSMWQILNLPSTYISSNFPIKMSSIDPEGKYLAVAGQRGFTHFSFVNQKWKIFGNADQEKDIRITGGLLWWKEFICMSCFNFIDQRDEIRFYSRNSNLDNSYSKISKVNSTILQMNIFKNLLVTFSVDCVIQVVGLEGGKDSTSKIILNKLIEIPIHNYIINNPYLVTFISLCPLFVGHFDEQLKKNVESVNSSMKSILVNVGGNLLMFQPDLDSLTSIPEDLKKTKPYSSLPPIIISSSVENYWVVCNQNNNVRLLNIYLNFSLWLNCGSSGVKVWLPLSGDEEKVQQANRIILTFPLKFYPLGLLANQSLLIGANSELACLNKNIAYCQIQKTTQLFMSFILEGLIRKGLDTDAKKLANGYRYLPYFLHILELLVHKISEEEATSSSSSSSNEKLLPKVVDFIKQFPEYLKIISHCTRKSEVAFWPYLFSIVGNPRLLFDQCLAQNDLETAASYLVVLQNTETVKPCENFSNMLLRAALKNCEWDLIKEIIRFLSAIDPSDLENDVFDLTSAMNTSTINNVSTTKQNVSRTNSSVLQSPNSSISKDDSIGKDESINNGSSASASKSKLTSKKSFTSQDCELNRKSIELSISEYANDLIKSYKIKKLFEMFANLNYFNIYKWLQQFQSTELVDNYVQGLSSLHFDFNWPYPIMINNQHKKTNSFVNEEILNNFLNEENEHNKNGENGDVKKNGNSQNENEEKDTFDFDLVAQELANTGSAQSEKELGFLIETFMLAKCYEWVFLLALILRKVSVLNDIIRQINKSEFPINIEKSLRQGIKDLDSWSKHECCGYRGIMKKLSKLSD